MKQISEKDIALLAELMSFRTATKDIPAVNRAVDHMKNLLTAEGLFCHIEKEGERKILFASTRDTKRPKLLINAHLDVVPAITPEQYTLKCDGDKLIGRGTGDCLGEAVTATRFMLDHKEYDVGVAYSTNEETGGSATGVLSSLGYGATGLIVVFDAGYGNVIYAQKGIIVLKLTASGKGGHSASPWTLDNPIEKLARGYVKLADSWKNPDADNIWLDSMQPCIISGGNAYNQVPDTAEMTINIRYTDESQRDSIIEKVRTLTGCEIEVLETSIPVNIAPDNPLIQEFCRTLKEYVKPDADGIPATVGELRRMCGATDARHWTRCGVPVLITGLRCAGAHASIEFTTRSSMGYLLGVFDAFVKKMDWK